MTFNERLDMLIKTNNTTAKEIVTRLEIGSTSITDWKRGKSTPSPKTLIGISQIFNISIDWLLTGEGEMYKASSALNTYNSSAMTAEENELIKFFNRLSEVDRTKILERIKTIVEIKGEADTLPQLKRRTNVTIIPENSPSKYENELEEYAVPAQREIQIFTLPASAGLGNYLSGESDYEILTLDTDKIPVKADFGIYISGDSMEPLIHDGDIVWIKEQIQLADRDIGIFVLDNEALCKKLEIDYANSVVRLLSLNQNYQPIEVKEYQTLKTVGKVLL